MKIMVTGGTGFVGSHAVAALSRAGHALRLLVRSPEKVDRALGPLGTPEVELVDGDVCDAGAVARALEGCDAVLHAANVYTFDPSRAAEMLRVNVDGTRLVLAQALAAGCDPVVHVSSVVAIFPGPDPMPEDPEVGAGCPGPYVQSKIAAERVARQHQAAGAPVVITYPGVVVGPHDPGPGEMVNVMRGVLANLYCFRAPELGLLLADVEWLARAHAGLFQRCLGPRRATMGGQYVPFDEVLAAFRAVTGRRLPALLPSPPFVARGLEIVLRVIEEATGARPPWTSEQLWGAQVWRPTHDRLARELAGEPPPFVETLRGALTWAVEVGHVSAESAGLAAAE